VRRAAMVLVRVGGTGRLAGLDGAVEAGRDSGAKRVHVACWDTGTEGLAVAGSGWVAGAEGLAVTSRVSSIGGVRTLLTRSG
jgi:hypothetical protein